MTTITVGSQNELAKALQDVKGGDTILLRSGTYDLDLTSSGRRSFDFTEKVTIASVDAGAQAQVKQLMVREAANIELKDIVFDYQRGGASLGPLDSDKKFWVESSAGITFDGVTFDGEKVNGYGVGTALRVKDSQDVAVLNSEFFDFEMAVSMSNNDDTIIANNDIRGISFDAMMFSGMEDITIAYNDFTDFNSRNDLHQDVIQFIAIKSGGMSSDIKIVGNVIDNPEETHGIFLGNSLYKDSGDMDAYYRNVYIADNVVHTAHKLAIVVMHGDNVLIEDNVVTKNNDEGVEKKIPLISVSTYSKNVYILDNEVQAVQDEANGSWVVEGNKTTPGRIGFFDMVYATTKVAELLREMPNSPADPYRPVIDIQPHDPDDPEDPVEPEDPPVDPDEPDEPVYPDDPVDPDEPTGDGVGADLRIKGDLRALYSGGVEIFGFDFAEGDELVFGRFDRGTFQDDRGGNRVDDFYRGASVRIDSALDIQEIVAHSPDVHAYASGKDLIIEIDQNRGTAEITLIGLAAAFEAANHPELF